MLSISNCPNPLVSWGYLFHDSIIFLSSKLSLSLKIISVSDPVELSPLMTWIDLYFRTWRSKKRVTRTCNKYNRHDIPLFIACFSIRSYCPKNWKNSQICISGLIFRPFGLLLTLKDLNITSSLALPSEFSICVIINSMWPFY